MDSTGDYMDIAANADSKNITSVGCEWGSTVEDTILVLMEESGVCCRQTRHSKTPALFTILGSSLTLTAH
jgi:hypothetical protein